MSAVSRTPSEDDVRTAVNTSGICSPVTPDDIEQQPLLAKRKGERTPLPVFQLAILCLVRLAEPIAYTQIFPYVNAMVEELHVTDNPADIGFYSGLVVSAAPHPSAAAPVDTGAQDSLFAVAQLFTIFQWGRLSGEITDKTNQAQGAFWCIGAIIGPLIGGTLSHPAERYPEVFGTYDFLKDRTLPSKVLEKKLKAAAKAELLRSPSSSSYGTLTPSMTPARPRDLSVDTPPTCVETPATKAVAPSTLSLLLDQRVRNVLIAGFLLSFVCVGWETVFILWAYTPMSLGGIARKAFEAALIT
ncbi:hypothetical protein FRC00_005673 [Tulasnella sp. 408]|nr:hypothetical protein FRC00_005673 [Tulasnella sp. 408]